MNILISVLVGVVAFVGGLFSHSSPLTYNGGGDSVQKFGTTNYPASLDSTVNLPNPGATDSVATVSHSALHTNENLGIIATETKLGTGASTATNNTVLIGNGVGTSAWSASPTLTGLTLSTLISASSTLVNFTSSNSTTTNATSTNSFSTTASSSNLFTASLQGAGLSSCTGNNVLQWSGGTFSCASSASAAIQTVSTTSLANMSTTTLRSIPFGTNLHLKFLVASTSNTALRVCFNEDWGGCKGIAATGLNYNMSSSLDGVVVTPTSDTSYLKFVAGAGTRNIKAAYNLDIFNGTSTAKIGTGIGTQSTSTDSGTTVTAGFFWASTTAAINSVSLVIDDLSGGNYIGAGTVMSAYVLP